MGAISVTPNSHFVNKIVSVATNMVTLVNYGDPIAIFGKNPRVASTCETGPNNKNTSIRTETHSPPPRL